MRTPPQLAALGYGLTHFRHSPAGDEAMIRLVTGLEQLMRREPYPPDGVTFLNDPRQLLGIGLAAETVRGKLPSFGEWLLRTSGDSRFRSADTRLELVRQHVRGILDSAALLPARSGSSEDAAHLALLHWMAAEGTARLPDADLTAFQRSVLRGALHSRAEDLAVPDAALVLAAAEDIVTASIDNAVLSPGHVSGILQRFSPAMKRWRYDNPGEVKKPVRWPVPSEREVQDIIWLLLRSAFDDLVDEEPLRKFGHSSYRPDFGLPRLGLLIEIKYVRSATEFKKIEKEIIQDSVPYLREKATYKKIIVFIYDASSSAQEHATTIDALLGVEGIADVVIASRPSQLPPPG